MDNVNIKQMACFGIILLSIVYPETDNKTRILATGLGVAGIMAIDYGYKLLK